MFHTTEDDTKGMERIKTTLTTSDSIHTRPYQLDLKQEYSKQTCLHDSCPECHGTGFKDRGGICVHHISCPCPKCSITC